MFSFFWHSVLRGGAQMSQVHIFFVWFPSLTLSLSLPIPVKIIWIMCNSRALIERKHRKWARELCVRVFFFRVWRNVICVQSAAWRMRNGHFTVLAHAKLKILMSRAVQKKKRVKERRSKRTHKTEEERHF